MEAFGAASGTTYSVAWIDCLARGPDLGRSVVFLGEHAAAGAPGGSSGPTAPRRGKRVPVDLPGFTLNRLSVSLFNHLYYRAQIPGSSLVAIEPYFYPLDAIDGWNRIYGRRGFVQFQAVLPLATSRDGLSRLLEESAKAGDASFLAVLKKMGRESFGLLSFPQEGYTLALDFPVHDGTWRLLRRLEQIVVEAGGRIYLAKDAAMSPATLEAGYPRLAQFRAIRRRYGLDRRFRSALSERLEI
jgi:FAD/FMN-containing dehydrogenase